MKNIKNSIFNIQSEIDFVNTALDIFHFQAVQNEVYAKYLKLLKRDHHDVSTIDQIPFLPIELFKNHKVLSGKYTPQLIFESSGTTTGDTSKHFVADAGLYQQSFTSTFKQFYGRPEDYCILALLPSYIERGGSSLVYMMNHLIESSENPDSGFYLENLHDLNQILQKRAVDLKPTLLIGVSFALLDLAERYPLPLTENIILMETGGMKGRRKEITRQELHEKLCKAFHLEKVHSEYGMTELLSQAYSTGSGTFNAPPWMKILFRDLYDPFSILPEGASGAVNVIDLANVFSCSFIATGDTGRQIDKDSFEITGRFDQAEVRGCNLMVV